MPHEIDFSALFTPFKLRDVTLPNRVVMPAMGLAICEGGIPSQEVADYYARRAAGGAGLVMTEGVYIDHPASGDNPMLGRFHGEPALEGWCNVARQVHAAGGVTFPELWHVGLIYSSYDMVTGTAHYRPELGQVSPSGYIAPGKKVCEGMTQAQIDEVIDAYGRGAETAMALGYDGIEIHGGHGYLIDQFFWSELNRRTDRYGGSPQARGRFAAEVVAEIRRRVGPGMPVALRISHWKMVNYQARIAETPQELEALLAPIVDAGVDLFDCSERRFWQPVFEDSDMNLAGWTKKVTGKPTMTIGSIGLDGDMQSSLMEGVDAGRDLSRFRTLMEMFDRGDFDLVGVGRAMISEPDWAKLVQAGRIDQLKPFSPRVISEALLPAVR
ncbi:NADH:flavin oxidoreductase [Phenylobacterium sp. LjRoot225]|uniref:NADH:flavin oxidoreductase n=1 Tax=Phenylobacterium sp. LjRoot225 TaxID=3342285 RepID=UPI003ECF1F57